MPTIRVFVTDKSGYPLLHSKIEAFDGKRLLGRTTDSRGQAAFSPRTLSGPVTVSVEYDHEGQPLKQQRTLAVGTTSIDIAFPEVDLGRPWMEFFKQNFPALLGLVLLIVSLALGFSFSAPTDLQTFLIRALFALGAGGVASIIPGFLNINLGLGSKLAITAGGALAVLLLMYIVNPPRFETDAGTLPVNALSTAPANAAASNASDSNRR